MKKAKPLLAFCVILLLWAAMITSQEKAASSVLVIPIKDEIDDGLAAFMDRVLSTVDAEKPDLIIYEIDTPGGSVSSLFHITDAITLAGDIPNCAYITDKAWSAGAFIAITCKQIYMAPASTIGSALPIQLIPGAQMPQPVEEKYKSAFRAKFRAMAEKNGYPPNIAMAMVDEEIEVLEVKINGKRMFLTQNEFEDEKRKLADKVNADIQMVKTISAAGQLLNLSATEAKDCTIAADIVETRAELLEKLGLEGVEVSVAHPTWSEALVRFISNPIVTTVLFAVGLMGIWMEFKIPGFGAPGITAIICFSLLFFGKYLAGLANVLEVLLFVLGVALLLLEIFVIPGFGIAGISGLVLIMVGLLLSLQRFVIPDTPWEVDTLATNIISLVVGAGISFVASFTLIVILSPYIPKVPMFGRLVLQAQSAGSEGLGVSGPPAPATDQVRGLLGQKGVALTDLRPSGKIRIGDDVHQAVTQGEYVNKDSEIEIIDVKGNVITVKEIV